MWRIRRKLCGGGGIWSVPLRKVGITCSLGNRSVDIWVDNVTIAKLRMKEITLVLVGAINKKLAYCA